MSPNNSLEELRSILTAESDPDLRMVGRVLKETERDIKELALGYAAEHLQATEIVSNQESANTLVNLLMKAELVSVKAGWLVFDLATLIKLEVIKFNETSEDVYLTEGFLDLPIIVQANDESQDQSVVKLLKAISNHNKAKTVIKLRTDFDLINLPKEDINLARIDYSGLHDETWLALNSEVLSGAKFVPEWLIAFIASLCEPTAVGNNFRLEPADNYTADLIVQNISRLRTRGTDLTQLDLKNRNLDGINFSRSILPDLTGSSLRDSCLISVHLENRDLTGVDLRCADLDGALLSDSSLANELTEERKVNSKIIGAKLKDANGLPDFVLEFICDNDGYLIDREDFVKRYNGPHDWVKGGMMFYLSQYFNGHKITLPEDLDLDGEDFSEVDFSGVDFSGHSLKEVNFSRARLLGADFSDCKLENICFNKADCTSVNFRDTNMTGCGFDNSILTGANLSNSKTSDSTTFYGATLKNTNFETAKSYSLDALLEAEDFGAINHPLMVSTPDRFVDTYAEFFIQDHGLFLKLNGVARCLNLTYSDFEAAECANYDFSGSYFHETNLTNADLEGAKFVGAYIWKLNLSGADLTGADFTNCTFIDPKEVVIDEDTCFDGVVGLPQNIVDSFTLVIED